MCDYDCEESVALEYVWRKARKEHRCYACWRLIHPGDSYHRSAQVFEGKVLGFAHCPRCWAIMEALFESGVDVVQWDLNCGETWENPPDDVAALAFMTAEEAQSLPRGE